ncbi:MAG: tyrosine--tRNA ligase [Chthoniobacterales bacterium]|nr:tyrosine--tRNA ligase [Chthoniobacterales bacterium]
MDPAESLEILCRGCAEIISRDELRRKLAAGRPLQVKLGVDPTAPDIHFGHTVTLQKLRQFQDLGHDGILLIGDFTAMIGDPSGRSATRPQLTHDEVLANAKTYQEQAFKVLDEKRTRVVFNGDWFKKMTFTDVIRLNSRVTLQQMLQREDFRERIDKSQPIRAHEVQYPIMQGWDSVMIQADVELGGTDQLFNIMVGRDLQKEEGQEPQVAMMLPILEGLDGTQKMSKSLGNAIGVNDAPGDMFGKVMSISDALMARYYTLLLSRDLPAEAHPMAAKKELARSLVERFHSAGEADAALEEFERRFSGRDLQNAELPAFNPAVPLIDVITAGVEAYAQCFGQDKSRGDIRRLAVQGSIQWRGEKVTDPKAMLDLSQSGILRLDKTRAVRVG